MRLILGSIVVSIPACHAGDRGSIPRRGGLYSFFLSYPFSSLFLRLQYTFKTLLLSVMHSFVVLNDFHEINDK